MNWYAIYTKSRYEKKVYTHLLEKSIQAYLPLQKQLKQWSDRKKWIEEPLIRSYVFVRITEKEYFNVLNTPGVVCYITFSGKAAPIRDIQIETLKCLLNTDIELEAINETLSPGEPVEIIAGRLMGLTGELIKYKGKKKVVIRIEQLSYSLLLTVPTGFIRNSYQISKVA
jgi:transcriptional antiterminator RfaH